MGAYELIELDKYAMLLAISGLNGFMFCESIETSWFQVWFTFGKVWSSDWNLSYIAKSEWAEFKSEFEWPNLFGLAWNLVCMLETYSIKLCMNLMRIG